MARGVRKSLVSSVVLLALIGVAGCSHYLLAQREPWRHEAELSCLNSGVLEEAPGRVRISSIEGPGVCGIDYPLKVSELGETRPLSYTDAPMLPPGSIPDASPPQGMPQHWPVIQSSTLPPPQPYGTPQYNPQPYNPQPYNPPQYGAQPYRPPPYNPPPQYSPAQYAAPPAGAPMSLSPPGIASPYAGAPGIANDPHPYYNAPAAPPVDVPASLYSPRPLSEQPGLAPPAPREGESPPVPPPGPLAAAPAGPVEVKPAATLACPLVSALDKWISAAVQPAALKWFRQPVVEIKQISSYSCRGMNGNPNAHISEHAFGNALDIAEFDLADGHRITVQHGWHGTPEEQGFLHDVQGAACQDFTTVLAPGANVYHYNHIHVDLMRRRGRPQICEPTAIPGEIAAARARAQYAQRYGDPRVTGSIKSRAHRPLAYTSGDDDNLPLAVPGDD